MEVWLKFLQRRRKRAGVECKDAHGTSFWSLLSSTQPMCLQSAAAPLKM